MGMETGTIGGCRSKILELLQQNPEGLALSHLALQLKIPRRTIYNALYSLKRQGKVINNRPLWQTGTSQYGSLNVPLSLPDSSQNINLHNLRFVLRLIQKPFWWGQRNNKLLKFKGIPTRAVTFGNCSYIQMMTDTCYVNLYRESIMFIMRKEYRANDPYDCLQEAIEEFMLIYNQVEKLCGFSFFRDGVPQVNIKSQHYVKLQDALARKLTKQGSLFQVFHNGKLRLLIDMSHPRGIEAVNAEYSLEDIDKYVRYTEDIITNPHYLPSEVTEHLGRVVSAIDGINRLQATFNANMMTHIKAIQELGSGVRKLTEVVQDIANHQAKQGRRQG